MKASRQLRADFWVYRTTERELGEGLLFQTAGRLCEGEVFDGSAVPVNLTCSKGAGCGGGSASTCGGPQASGLDEEEADVLLDEDDTKAGRDAFGFDPGEDPDHQGELRLPKIGGVYYKRDGNYKAWAASWHIKGKRVRRYFTVKKHGFK